MKVALLIPSIGFGAGIETPAIRLLAETIARSVEVHAFALHYPRPQDALHSADLTLHPASQSGARFARRWAATVAAIRSEHTRSPFDVLHALWLHEPGTVAVAAASILRLPVVASIGGAEVVALSDINYGAMRQPRGRVMTANVLQRATIVTGGSEYVLRRAQSIVPHRDPARFRRAPLPVDAGRLSQPSGRSYDARSPQLLHAASLIPVKDQRTLLRAFRQVVDVVPGARLTIAGEDPFGVRGELDRLVGELMLGGAVTFVGHRPHAEMAALYSAADVFVLSSRHESQAMVVLEAAASGVPTVGTAVGVVPELAPSAALAVRPGDHSALAGAIIDLVTDPVRLERMGRLARDRVLAEYDAQVACDRFLSLYADAIGLARR